MQPVAALVSKFWQWRLPQPIAPITDPPTKQFEDNFVRDVVKFFGLGYADKCAEPLRQQLSLVPPGDPVMLVSHSFGTVLAYEVLIRDLPALGVNIDTWVTMGTPLSWAVDLQSRVPQWQEQLMVEIDQGLQPVLAAARDTLSQIGDLARQTLGSVFGWGKPSITGELFEVPPKQFPPVGVDRWFNIFDTRDPVACAGGFSGLLGGLEVGSSYLFGANERAFDVEIRNDACPANITNPDMRAHEDFSGYGQCAQLAQLVADFWTRHNGTWSN